MDFEAYDRLDPDEALARINGALPPSGIRILAIRPIRLDLPALGEVIRAARYRAEPTDGSDVERGVAAFARGAGGTVRREKKSGKLHTFDLATEVLEVDRVEPSGLRMLLALHPGGASIRPDEVLGGLFGDDRAQFRLTREELLVDWNGRWLDPLLAATTGHGQ
jgi:hypothetical protein